MKFKEFVTRERKMIFGGSIVLAILLSGIAYIIPGNGSGIASSFFVNISATELTTAIGVLYIDYLLAREKHSSHKDARTLAMFDLKSVLDQVQLASMELYGFSPEKSITDATSTREFMNRLEEGKREYFKNLGKKNDTSTANLANIRSALPDLRNAQNAIDLIRSRYDFALTDKDLTEIVKFHVNLRTVIAILSMSDIFTSDSKSPFLKQLVIGMNQQIEKLARCSENHE